jgi:hypothetical protein
MDDLEPPSISELNDQVQSLRDQILTLSQIVHFHNLNNIPMKYRKIYPKKGEYMFFELDCFNRKPKFSGQIIIYPTLEELHPAEKEPDYNAAKERMNRYAEEHKKRNGMD